jgi:hypothetical protein
LWPFLQACYSVCSSVWSTAPSCGWAPGLTTVSTLCEWTQFHKDWGMHLHLITIGA